MSSTNTTEQAPVSPTHEDFHWIHGSGREEKFADFIELTRDISAGIVSCMQIIHASDLVREANQDAKFKQQVAPSIGKTDVARLFRLSMNAAALLLHAAEERIYNLNKSRSNNQG